MPDYSSPDVLHRAALSAKRFAPRSAAPFLNKSVTDETRRAYRKVVANFFQFLSDKLNLWSTTARWNSTIP